MLKLSRVLFVVLIFIACRAVLAQQAEVTIGAQTWTYDRLYPLLDGLFEDTVSTQLASLVLNPNASNSTQLDALVQSFQIQAGYNQLSGVQNSVAAQMAVANLGYQSTLAQQQQSILLQQLSAQKLLTQAKQTLSDATQKGSAADIATATQAVAVAQSNVDGLTAEMALIKAPTTPYTPSGATNSIAPQLATSTSSVPASILASGIPSGGPSFPSTKQLDNQMDLLWSRLARVLGTMSRPDSMATDDRIYLVAFDTGTFPLKSRKNKILETRYQLTCTGISGQPITVLDMFPRVAAVNVTNTSYRDSSFNLGSVFAFFGFGINAGYNREHLRLSQTLGQSSYITGYGVGQDTFGWKFGIPLGDDMVSSDIKRTFVLVRIAAACKTPTLALVGSGWADRKKVVTLQAPADQPTSLATAAATMATPVAPKPAAEAVVSMSFNRLSYDPQKYSASNPALVPLAIELAQPVDQQATVYVNGMVLRRVRDTFGRAIPGGIGSNGLLEEAVSISQPNTWMPVSSHSVLVNLDGGQFGESFPAIEIVAPGRPAMSINDVIASGETVTVSGNTFTCVRASSCRIPSVAYRQPVGARVGVSRWRSDPSRPKVYQVIFTVADAQTGTGSAKNSTGTSVQLLTASTDNAWGGSAEVYLQLQDGNTEKQFKLPCDSAASSGDRLVCSLDLTKLNPPPTFDSDGEVHFHILDPDHVGAPLEAWPSMAQCSPCGSPTEWSVTTPTWKEATQTWGFDVQFVNVTPSASVVITGASEIGTSKFACTNGICTAHFDIAKTALLSWFDQMDVQIDNDADDRWQLLNIRTLIGPVVTSMTPDFASWSGVNFTTVYSGLEVGKGTTAIAIDCPTVTTCSLTGGSAALPTKGGVLYLKLAGGAGGDVPLMQLNPDGSMASISYQPKPTAAAAPPPAVAGGTATTQPPPGQTAPPTSSNFSAPARPNIINKFGALAMLKGVAK